MVSVTDEDFKHLAAFRGCGNPAGNYWFIGLEEGFKSKDKLNYSTELQHEIKVRATWLDLEDLHQMRASLSIPMRGNEPNWYAKARIALKLDGDSEWDKPASLNGISGHARIYKENRLGRFDGDTFLTELYPLPTPDHKPEHWPYTSPYRNRPAYEKAVKQGRSKLIRELWSQHAPEFVFCEGKGDWDSFKELFGGSYFQLIDRRGNRGGLVSATRHDQAQAAHVRKSMIVLTHHMSRLNSDLERLGNIVDAALAMKAQHVR